MLLVRALRLDAGGSADSGEGLPSFSVDLALNPGQCLGVFGESGTGKSLMLRAIADMDPHQGEISWQGQTQQSMTGPEWRRRVQWVPAESGWWSDRVGDHFDGTRPVDLDRLGFDSAVMDWQVSRLSSGERQRLALLRSWQLKPEVWLLDEPTSALDVTNIARVEEWIAGLRRQQDLVVIWVSHDRAQLGRVSDRLAQLTAEGLRLDLELSTEAEAM